MNDATAPVTMWFDQRIVLRRSPIHGLGTYATHPIGAGELLILVNGGIVFSRQEWDAGKIQLEAEMYNQEHLADGRFIVTPKLFQYYVNHSCDANIVDLARSPTATQYAAARDISAGEELTADYYTEATLAACACGSRRCRWTKTQ